MTTRLIGAIIMVHGDDSGLVLPPRIAPVQVDVIPIMQNKEGVLDKAHEVLETLRAAGLRAKLDDTDKSPGWKFSEQEMRGIPVRVEMDLVISRQIRRSLFVVIPEKRSRYLWIHWQKRSQRSWIPCKQRC